MRGIMKGLGIALGMSVSAAALPANFSGAVTMLEVWPSGNVAFTLAVPGPCNGQFIVNVSSMGAKNMYAALLASKEAGRTIRVSQTVCGPADGYGGNYAVVDYLYPED